MKKLMITAAAAAMVGAVFAEANYQLADQKVWFDETQFVVFKVAASTSKAINLNDEKDLGKTLKYTDKAIDGVLYYEYTDDAKTNGLWKAFARGKDEADALKIAKDYLGGNDGSFQYPVFVNNAENITKAIAGINYKITAGIFDEDAEGYTYSNLALKYIKISGQGGSVKVPDWDNIQVKAVKFANSGNFKATVKTYKNQDARDKALNAYLKKLEK